LEVRILNELWAYFAEVWILKGLGELSGQHNGFDGVGVENSRLMVALYLPFVK
jgi:hypothetical protein